MSGDTTTLTVDADGRRVLIAALDLLQRVAMGQWREVVEHAPNVIDGDYAGLFGTCAEQLMHVRSSYTANPHLRHRNAALSISGAGDDARLACDLWHALGGGMESRRDDRLTSANIKVDPS